MKYYILKLKIYRCGADYNVNSNQIKSQFYLLIDIKKQISLSIGGTNEDIYIKNLHQQHLQFFFREKNIIFYALAKCNLRTKTSRTELSHKQNLSFPIIDKFVFEIEFDNGSKVVGFLEEQKDILSEEDKQFLERKYGKICLKFVGKSSLIYQTQSGKALKILRPSYGKQKGIVSRFLHGAKEIAIFTDPSQQEIEAIEHPKDDLCYVRRTFHEGEDLQNFLARRGILPIEEAKVIICAIAKCLQNFESCNYVCRNLTPENIIIDQYNIIRIVGFFLLKKNYDDDDDRMTADTVKMHIPKYSSPEQIADTKSVDIASDIFSLGVIFYELIVGNVPIPCENLINLCRCMQQKQRVMDFYEIQQVAPNVPKEIASLIEKMFLQNQNKRPRPKDIVTMFSSEITAIENRAKKQNDSFKNNDFSEVDGCTSILENILNSDIEDPHDSFIPTKVQSETSNLPCWEEFKNNNAGNEFLQQHSRVAVEQQTKLTNTPNILAQRNTSSLKQSNSNNNATINFSSSYLVSEQNQSQTLSTDTYFLAGNTDSCDQTISVDDVSSLKNKEHKYCLEVLVGNEQDKRTYVFNGNIPIIIGRQGNCSIKHDILISRKHAMLHIVNGQCILQDLQSRNGVYIGSKKIGQEKIENGTAFRLGSTTFMFTIE